MTISPQWISLEFPELSNVSPLSQGGQKVVFRADHPIEGKVVLKLIHLGQDAESVRREILAVTCIASNRVPKILDHGQKHTSLGPCFWIREQLIEGRTLRNRVQANVLSPTETLRLTLHILQALVHAEKAKIVHRDVKPENIMHDTSGSFWLLDFGIARHLELNSMTPTANPFGKMTLGYAPPEQCRNLKSDIDARADMFALGVTIHESTFGKNPFRDGAKDALEIIRRVENAHLPPTLLPITAADDFRDLISAFTQKRRDHRVPTAAEALIWCTEIATLNGVD